MSGPSSLKDAEFIELFKSVGPSETARTMGITVRAVHRRRERLEKRLGGQISGPAHHQNTRRAEEHAQRIGLQVDTGTVFIGSDSHYWPGLVSTAHQGLLCLARDFKPKLIIKNGDVLDGATISRHPPIGWEDRPKLIDELDTVKERLAEIRDASPNSRFIWPLGNHDARYETRLATLAPEFAKIHGFHLKDHFPEWEPCWSAWINEDAVVKHRFKGGIHAPWNNTIYAGRTMVTGHLHSQKVMPFTDYNGTRWGVDAGTMADPHGPQFEYLEDNPRNWREGFCILTYRNGVLLQPELVRVHAPNVLDFRGELINV